MGREGFVVRVRMPVCEEEAEERVCEHRHMHVYTATIQAWRAWIEAMAHAAWSRTRSVHLDAWTGLPPRRETETEAGRRDGGSMQGGSEEKRRTRGNMSLGRACPTSCTCLRTRTVSEGFNAV